MDYAVVSAPAAPVRRKPDHRKEMVNQLLFGEMVKVLRTKGSLWVKVRSLHDGYEGWATNTLLEQVDKATATARCEHGTTDMLSLLKAGERRMQIPAGSSLPFFSNGTGWLGTTEFTVEGGWINRLMQKPGAELLESLVMPWLNAPYLWGGRTPLGVDCSGFTQIIYKQLGFDLPRDAWQQAQEGKSVQKFADTQAGDLAFFNNKEDIVHVGILLEGGRIIHASGKVRIDKIDKKGIIDAATGERLLSLKAVRRIW